MNRNAANHGGADPWSARFPLDPLLANEISFPMVHKPTGASAADRGIRPTPHE